MGYKTTFLINTVAQLTIQNLVVPAVQQAPEMIGKIRSKRKWTLQFFCLSVSNPADSFCCVTEAPITADPISLLRQQTLSPLLPLLFVPVRFSKNGLAGLSIRPSSFSAATPISQHWLGQPNSMASVKAVNDAGIELLSLQRNSDRMTFVVAVTASAAQTAMADLSMKHPLWNELNQSGPSTSGFLAQVFS